MNCNDNIDNDHGKFIAHAFLYLYFVARHHVIFFADEKKGEKKIMKYKKVFDAFKIALNSAFQSNPFFADLVRLHKYFSFVGSAHKIRSSNERMKGKTRMQCHSLNLLPMSIEQNEFKIVHSNAKQS